MANPLNTFIKILLILFATVFFSCKNDSYIKNDYLKNKILDFQNDNTGYGFIDTSCNYRIVTINKLKKFYSISFEIGYPTTIKNLYTVVKLNEKKILFYSNFDIGEFVYTQKPFNPNAYDITLASDNWEDSYYFDEYYFNGIVFTKDTSYFYINPRSL